MTMLAPKEVLQQSWIGAAISPSRLIKSERSKAIALATPTALILGLIFILPLGVLLSASFVDAEGLSLETYRRLLGTSHNQMVIWNSLKFAMLTTVFSLALAYPASFALARARGAIRSLALICLLLPLAASVIVKSFAWTILLRSNGVVNNFLMMTGIIGQPIRMIFTEIALIVGSVNIHLPFMLLPIYAVVAQFDRRLSDAAATLGASPVVAFLRVTVPMTMPGVIAGVALVFSLSVSAYVIPTLLIGERFPVLSRTIFDAYLVTREPAFGAAAGVVLLLIAITVVTLSSRFEKMEGGR